MNIQIDGDIVADDVHLIIDGRAGDVPPSPDPPTPPLPYDAEVEYLQVGTPPCGIDTGILIPAGTNFTLVVDGAAGNSTGLQSLISNYGAGPYGVNIYSSSNTIQAWTGQQGYIGISWQGYRRVVTFSRNGSLYTLSTESRSATLTAYTDSIYHVYLFRRGDGTSKEFAMDGSKVYSAKVYIADALVRDFTPVRVGSGSSAVGYLYDGVSGELFGNSESGAFVVGPDKV